MKCNLYTAIILALVILCQTILSSSSEVDASKLARKNKKVALRHKKIVADVSNFDVDSVEPVAVAACALTAATTFASLTGTSNKQCAQGVDMIVQAAKAKGYAVDDYGVCWRFCVASNDNAIKTGWPTDCTKKNSSSLKFRFFYTQAKKIDKVMSKRDELFGQLTKAGDCTFLTKVLSG